ncbi:uncharacterized protein V6R79_010966 [Siganus canaliculatus]
MLVALVAFSGSSVVCVSCRHMVTLVLILAAVLSLAADPFYFLSPLYLRVRCAAFSGPDECVGIRLGDADGCGGSALGCGGHVVFLGGPGPGPGGAGSRAPAAAAVDPLNVLRCEQTVWVGILMKCFLSFSGGVLRRPAVSTRSCGSNTEASSAGLVLTDVSALTAFLRADVSLMTLISQHNFYSPLVTSVVSTVVFPVAALFVFSTHLEDDGELVFLYEHGATL